MAIAPEHLNALLVAREVHTGVFATKQRKTCVVVKVSKEGHVHYLHFDSCTVQLTASFKEKFLVDYPVELYHYPAMRAIRQFKQYILQGFACTDAARKVINAVLVK
jgi:hypothetical protein